MQYIANLCPDIAGTAVFDARSLVRIFNDSAYFNDSTICSDGSGGIELAKMKLPLDTIKTSYLKVYPNPASDLINISYTIDVKATEIIVTDIAGREVQRQKIISINSPCTMDIKALANGIYFLQLKKEEEILGVAKFAKE